MKDNKIKKEELVNKVAVVDITEINMDNMYLHYTNIENLESIFDKGLLPKIGINAMMVEKTKKVFFTVGDKGALAIMDVWLKWLIAKPKTNIIYWYGAFLLRIPFFPTIFHKIIININFNSKNKKYWAFKTLNKILDNSAYLLLNLEENVDFSFDDIDEAKDLFKHAPDYINLLYHNYNDDIDVKIEFWNMHTFSDVIIDKNKISLVTVNNSYSANEIVKYLANQNMEYVKNECKLLYEYLNYIDSK